MSDTAVETFAEPFGQRGIRQFVRPLVIVCSVFGLFLSTFMLLRSQNLHESFYQVAEGRRIELTSAIDQIFITLSPARSGEPQSTVWVYNSFPAASARDGWADSWLKFVGVEWGDEPDTRFRNQNLTCWRFRVRWRTLVLIFLLPLVWEVIRLKRRRRVASIDAPG